MITYAPNINDTQKQGINALVQSGRAFNETDAKNYAYATGAQDFSQYVGKTGSQITMPSSFDASSLGTGTQFQTGNLENPTDPTPYIQSLGEATAQAQKDFQALQKSSAESSGVSTLESGRTGLTGRLTSALDKLTGKGTALQQAEADLGVPQDLSRLKEVNLQMTNLTNEYNKRIASIPGQGIGLTTGAVAQLTDREKRLAATEIGALSAVSQALQGNIALSQSTAERTVNMQFEPIEQEIKNLQTQLDLNYDDLSRAEKKQADELNFVLQERQAQVDQAKEDRLAVINMASEAAQQGADTVTLNKILKAGTIEDALAIAGDSLGGEFRMQQEQQQFENNLSTQKLNLDTLSTNAQIANIQSEIANRGLQGQGYDPAEILAYAQQYAATGTIPTGIPKGSFGVLSQVAKEAPKPTGTLVNNITGVKDSKLGATEQDDISALYNITELTNDLLELDKERAGGIIAGTFGKVFGSNDQAAYLTKRKAIVDEIQRMQSGAALTEEEQAFYKDYLPGRFSESLFLGQDSEKKIENFAEVMNTKLENALKINNLSIYGYSKVKVGDQEFKVGDVIESNGQTGTILPDGSISIQESFNSPLSMGVKSSDVSKIKDGAKVVNAFGTGIATGIQAGSSKWKWGLDFVLNGGKGASVPAPFSGTVVAAANNKGFGNQVKIKLADGSEMWISHLDGINVKPGQKITAGMIIGKQGNTGALLSGSGQELTAAQRAAGRGTHLDITVKKPDGKYMTSQQVASLLGTRIS